MAPKNRRRGVSSEVRTNQNGELVSEETGQGKADEEYTPPEDTPIPTEEELQAGEVAAVFFAPESARGFDLVLVEVWRIEDERVLIDSPHSDKGVWVPRRSIRRGCVQSGRWRPKWATDQERSKEV